MKPNRSNPLFVAFFRANVMSAVMVVSLTALAVNPAQAANQTYQDANILNTWNTTDANWDAGAPWVDGNSAIFGGTGEPVTVTAVSPNGITFGSSGYVLSGGTITLGLADTPITADSDATISSIIAGGTNGFSKSGTGILTLGGVNTYSGAINVAVGTLKLGAATGLGSGTSLVTVASGSTLDAAGFSAGARPISISGTGVGGVGAIYNSSTTTGAGVGAITLDANATISNAYPSPDSSKMLSTGTLNLGGNKLTISAGVISTAMQNIASGDLDINSGGVLYYTNGGSQNNVTGTITVKTGGRLDTRDSNNTGVTSTHTIALNGGILSNGGIANNNGGGAGATLKNNITVDATNGGTISAVSGGFGLSIKLAGSVSGTGALSITNNGVEFRGDTSGYFGTATATGGTITFNPTPAAQVFNGILAGSRPVTKSGANTTTFNGSNTYTGTTTVSAGTLVLTGNNTSTTGATTVASAGTLNLDYGTNNNRKIGSGVLTLSGGTIELSGGSTTDSVASTTLSAITKSTVTRSSGSSVLNLGAITPGTGSINFGQSGIAKTTTANNASGYLGTWATINGSDLAMNDGANNIVAYTGSAVVTRRFSGTQTIADAAGSNVQITEGSGAAGNILLGSATTTINSINQSAIGGNSAAVIDPAGQTLAANSVLVTSGAGSLTFGTGTNNGTLKSAGTALEFRDQANAGITVNSIIANGTGTSSLTKYDSSTLTLNGINSYTGGTIVQDGTLKLGNASALPATGTVTLNNSSFLDLNGFGATIPSLAGASTSTVTDNSATPGTSTLAITAAGSIPNKIINGASRALALRITNANGNFVLTNGSNTFSGGIVLTHNATGTRMTCGTITAGAYGTGAITVGETAADKAGIYLGTATQTLTNPVIANTGLGTDRLGTFRVGASGITLSGQVTANLASVTFGNSTGENGGITVSGKVTGPSGLSLASDSNSGTSLGVTLTNAANDYAGNSVINQNPQVGKSQSLILGLANVIPNGIGKGNVTINTNSTGVGRLNLGGFSETINGLSGNGTVDGVSGSPVLTVGDNNATSSFSGTLVNAAGSLSLTKIGSGTLTLSGANAHTGITSINAGTLAITGSPTGNSAVALNGGNLTLDYGTNDTSKIHDSAVLTLNGGTLTLAGATGSHTEAVASTTLGGGVTLNRSGLNTAKIALGAITRGTGGALEVAAAGLATTTNANVNGILPGITLAGGLAMNDGSDNIVAYNGGYADVPRLGGIISNGATNQVRIINGGAGSDITLDGTLTNTVSTLTNTSTDGLAAISIANARVLRLGAGGTILSPATSAGLTISGAGTLTAGGADNTIGDLLVLNQSATDTSIGAVIANNGSGAVSLTKYGSGALNLTGVNTFTGGMRLNEGSIVAQINATQNSLGSGAVTVSGGTSLALNITNTSVATLNVSNVFSGGGTLQMRFADAGTARNLVLNGTTPLSTFTGTIRLSLANGATTTGDKWNCTNFGTIPGSLIIDSGTQFLATSGTTTFSSGITVSGTGNTESRGAIRLIGTLGGNIVLAGDTTLGTEGGTLPGAITSGAAGTQTLTLGSTISTGNATLSGSIGGGTGTIALIKTRTGTVTLSGASTFTGSVLVNDGVLLSSNAAGLGAATQITVENSDSSSSNDNKLQLAGGTTQGSGAVLTLYNSAISGTVGNARTLLENQSGNNTWAGGIVLRGGTLQALTSATSTTLTINGSVTQHGSEPSTGIFIRGAGNGVINGNLSLGSATLTKTDGGTWTIATSGNTWGNTGVSVGTLRMGAANALPSTTLVTMGQGDSNNATLDLNGFNQTIADLASTAGSGSRTITSAAVAKLTLNNPGPSSYGGILAGTGLSLTKSGAGSLTLSGVNTYAGNTTVSAGTLTLADNARLRFVIGNASGINNSLTGAGTATLAGDFAIDLTAASAVTSGTWILEDVSTLTGPYEPTFQVVDTNGTPWTNAGGNKWTKTVGSKTWTFDETTGTLSLGSYGSWADLHAGGQTADLDFDGDGVKNGLEWVLGGDETTNDLAKLPTISSSLGNMVFTFVRDQQSINADTLTKIEVGTGLVAWPDVYNVGADTADSTSGVSIQKDTPTTGKDTVILSVQQSPDTKKFGRLKVTVTTP